MLENNILLKVFNIEDFDKTTIKNCQYLDENKDDLELFKINKEGFSRIKEYLNNFEYSFEELLFFISLKACSNKENFKIIIEPLEKIIKSCKEQIFKDLDKYKIDSKCFDKLHVGLYQSFLDIKDTTSFLDYILHNIVFSISRSESIYKRGEQNYYDIEYLTEYLFKYHKKDFENWFFKTKNNNIKLIFVYSCFTFEYFDTSFILDKENINSKIAIVRIINILMFFGINNHLLPLSILGNDILKFEDILQCKRISDNEKLYYLFYYVNNNFRMLNSNNLQTEKENEKKLLDILKKFKRILQDITEQDLENIKNLSEIIIFDIISIVKDSKKKNDLYEVYIKKYLKKDIEAIFDRSYDIEKILKANIYGAILRRSKNGKLIEEVENQFKLSEEKVNIPYYYYTNHKLWEFNISKMMYYLIVIYIFYHRKNKGKIKEYKERFKKAKKEFFHYFYRKDEIRTKSFFEELLGQIK